MSRSRNIQTVAVLLVDCGLIDTKCSFKKFDYCIDQCSNNCVSIKMQASIAIPVKTGSNAQEDVNSFRQYILIIDLCRIDTNDVKIMMFC